MSRRPAGAIWLIWPGTGIRGCVEMRPPRLTTAGTSAEEAVLGTAHNTDETHHHIPPAFLIPEDILLLSKPSPGAARALQQSTVNPLGQALCLQATKIGRAADGVLRASSSPSCPSPVTLCRDRKHSEPQPRGVVPPCAKEIRNQDPTLQTMLFSFSYASTDDCSPSPF